MQIYSLCSSQICQLYLTKSKPRYSVKPGMKKKIAFSQDVCIKKKSGRSKLTPRKAARKVKQIKMRLKINMMEIQRKEGAFMFSLAKVKNLGAETLARALLVIFVAAGTEKEYFYLLLHHSVSPYLGLPQRKSILHLTLSTSSPSLAPTLSLYSLAKSIHLRLGLPLLLLPDSAISIILFPT